jgi:glucokinase
MKELLGTEIYIENDANAASLAEALVGAAKGTENSVMLTLGTGVGSGIIIGGKIFTGGLNSAGAELGHMVIKVDGRQCACGRRGCVECYCSAVGLANMTREKMHELSMKGIPSRLFDIAEEDGKIGARTPFKAMRDGDEHGRAIVEKYVKYLGLCIANVINIFQPEVISIGGGVSNEGDNLIIPLRAVADTEQYTRDNDVRTTICTAKLGTDAGIVGAAGLGRQFTNSL